MMKRSLRWFWLLVAALPAVGPLLIIRQDGVDFHFLDEWEPGIAGVIVRFHQHQLTLADLFGQNNEHRPVMPRLLLLLTNPLTHWNNIAVLVMEWMIVLATSLIILNLVRRTAEPESQPISRGPLSLRIIVVWFLANLLIFTPLQYENWLWGIGLVNVMPLFFIFLAFWISISNLHWRVQTAVCVALAVAATYSQGGGVLAWPLIAILLLRPSSNVPVQCRKWVLTGWIVACAVSVGLYYYHYAKPAHGGAHAYSTDPLAILLYNLAYAGAAFSPDTNTTTAVTTTCMVYGSIMLAMLLGTAAYFAHAWTRGRRPLCDRMLLWLTVALYGILSGLTASFFRAGFGPQQALSSRYVTYAIYIPIALLNLVPMIADDLRTRHPQRYRGIAAQSPILLAGVIFVLHLTTILNALHHSRDMRAFRRQGKAALLLVDVLPHNPAIRDLVGAPQNVLAYADVLNEMGYLQPRLIHSRDARQFAASESRDNAPVVGRLDFCSGNDGLITVVGWALNRRAMQWADGVFLTYDAPDGQRIIFAAARMSLQRKDLLEQNGDPIYEFCGWEAKFPPSAIPAGLKTIQVRAWALDVDSGRAYPLSGICRMKW